VAMSGTTAFIGAFLSHSFSGEAYIYDEV
jgi:hypothetical protein